VSSDLTNISHSLTNPLAHRFALRPNPKLRRGLRKPRGRPVQRPFFQDRGGEEVGEWPSKVHHTRGEGVSKEGGQKEVEVQETSITSSVAPPRPAAGGERQIQGGEGARETATDEGNEGEGGEKGKAKEDRCRDGLGQQLAIRYIFKYVCCI